MKSFTFLCGYLTLVMIVMPDKSGTSLLAGAGWGRIRWDVDALD